MKSEEPADAKLVGALMVAVATTAVFARALSCDFFHIDDYLFVVQNPAVNGGLTLDGVAWAFTHPMSGNWTPLAWISHMLDVSLFGTVPAGHHATSVLLHAANSALLFGLLARTTGALGRSAFAALLFALHPMRVESVVWVAERRDVLSGSFGLLSLLAYSRYTEESRKAPYFGALGFFAMALASKSMLVTLPCVMLLLDGWPLRRIDWGAFPRSFGRLVLEKLPFFLLAAVASALTVAAQADVGALVPEHFLSSAERAANAAVALATYVVKTFWPTNLSVMVLHPALFGGPGHGALEVGGALALLGCISLATWVFRRHGYPWVAWLWFVGTLVPTLGWWQAGIQGMAYRYTYLPHVGLCIGIAWGLADAAARVRANAALRRGMALAPVCALAALSFVQIGHWRTTFTLYAYNIEASGGAWNHFFYMGRAHLVEGAPVQALPYLGEAHKRLPQGTRGDLARARASVLLELGRAFEGSGDLAQARKAYEESLRTAPNRDARDAYERLRSAP